MHVQNKKYEMYFMVVVLGRGGGREVCKIVLLKIRYHNVRNGDSHAKHDFFRCKLFSKQKTQSILTLNFIDKHY